MSEKTQAGLSEGAAAAEFRKHIHWPGLGRCSCGVEIPEVACGCGDENPFHDHLAAIAAEVAESTPSGREDTPAPRPRSPSEHIAPMDTLYTAGVAAMLRAALAASQRGEQ